MAETPIPKLRPLPSRPLRLLPSRPLRPLPSRPLPSRPLPLSLENEIQDNTESTDIILKKLHLNTSFKNDKEYKKFLFLEHIYNLYIYHKNNSYDFKLIFEFNFDLNIFLKTLNILYSCVYKELNCEDNIYFDYKNEQYFNISILPCGHYFFRDNLKKLSNKNCPLCKKNFEHYYTINLDYLRSEILPSILFFYNVEKIPEEPIEPIEPKKPKKPFLYLIYQKYQGEMKKYKGEMKKYKEDKEKYINYINYILFKKLFNLYFINNIDYDRNNLNRQNINKTYELIRDGNLKVDYKKNNLLILPCSHFICSDILKDSICSTCSIHYRYTDCVIIPLNDDDNPPNPVLSTGGENIKIKKYKKYLNKFDLEKLYNIAINKKIKITLKTSKKQIINKLVKFKFP